MVEGLKDNPYWPALILKRHSLSIVLSPNRCVKYVLVRYDFFCSPIFMHYRDYYNIMWLYSRISAFYLKELRIIYIFETITNRVSST